MEQAPEPGRLPAPPEPSPIAAVAAEDMGPPAPARRVSFGFALSPPSVMIIVRGGIRHFFCRWSEVLEFARTGDTVNVFASEAEIGTLFEHLRTREDLGEAAPDLLLLPLEGWTVARVYAHLDEPMPEGPQDAVFDIIARLRLHRDSRYVFTLGEHDPDRY